MKVSIEFDDPDLISASVSRPSDELTFNEALELVRYALNAVGYSEKLIESRILDE